MKRWSLRHFSLYHRGTWDSVHEHRGHAFALCYDKVEIIQDNFDVVFEDLEIFPVGMELETTVSYWYSYTVLQMVLNNHSCINYNIKLKGFRDKILTG